MDECKSHIVYEKYLKEPAPLIVKKSVKNNAEPETCNSLLSDHTDFVDSLRQNKRLWRVPWFIVIMCFIQAVRSSVDVYSTDAVGRICTVHPKNVDCFYLRLLLVNVRGPISFENLRTVDGVLCATFQEVYQWMNFLASDNHWDTPLADATISMYLIANRCVRQHLMFMPDRTNEYWRYITYMLLHSDVLHLTMNICLQCLIGFCLESEQSHAKVATIYVIGGISGSIGTLYLQPQLSLMGASAGVYAMLMSHIPHLLKNFYNLPHRYLRIAALVILLLSDVCFTTFHVLINHNTNPRICLEAHVAGALTGLVLGFLIYSAKKVKKRPNVWLVCNS